MRTPPAPPPRPPAAGPPPRGRAGFTLVEMLVCAAVVGLLAAIALPRFANTTARADLAAARSDLHNVATMQESYFHEHRAYAGAVALLGAQASRGVELTVVEATGTGWSARAVRPGAVPVTCAVYHGQAAPLAPASAEGVIACR